MMQPSQLANGLQFSPVSIAKYSPEDIVASYPTYEVKYAKLEQLLAAQQWQAADEETFAILSMLCGLTSDRIVKIGNISCYELHMLDLLWQKYSHGRFGFGVQQRIWQQLCAAESIEIHSSQHQQWQKLCDRLGWNHTGEALKIPAGHFPSRLAVDDRASVFYPIEVFIRLYIRLEGCQSSMNA
jgi:hypothetical protein